MKILMLNYEYPPIGGGAGAIAQYIAEGLCNEGNSVHVVTTGFGNYEKETEKDRLRITRLSSKRKHAYKSNPFEMMYWVRHSTKYLRKHLRTNKYDLCFAHFALPGGEVAYNMKNKFGLPYVIISHGHDIPWFYPAQMFFYHMLTYSWIKKIVTNSKALFVQSDEMEKNAALFLGKRYSSLIRQIPNGWDSDFFYPSENIKDGDFNILFPGRLVKQKDPFTLLRAVKKLKEMIPEIKLMVSGDGPLRKEMENWCKKNDITGIVEFKGWISREQIRECYQNASLVVLPSMNEGMSMATLEALACKTYVIVTDVSRNSLLIDEGVNGNIIPQRNPEKLAETILDFYENKYLKNYVIPEESIEKVDSIYSWEKINKQYDKELRELLGL